MGCIALKSVATWGSEGVLVLGEVTSRTLWLREERQSRGVCVLG